jgi:hypothetical protein
MQPRQISLKYHAIITAVRMYEKLIQSSHLYYILFCLSNICIGHDLDTIHKPYTSLNSPYSTVIKSLNKKVVFLDVFSFLSVAYEHHYIAIDIEQIRY